MEANILMKPTQVADPSRTHFHSIDSIMFFVFSFVRSLVPFCAKLAVIIFVFDDAVFNGTVGERT